MKKCVCSIFLVITMAAIVVAQTTTGRLAGTVEGPDGALPGATVTVKDNRTGKEISVVTNESGSYQFPQLEFGTYTITVVSNGFKTFVATDVKIDVGREYTYNPSLEIGDVQESVTVTAGADIVTSSSSQISNTVSPQQILSLPLLTRNPLTLTTLQAGVQSNPFQGTSINGMRTTMTNITRDGINIQDTFIRSNATDFAPGRPSVDDTGEFTISTSNTEADQGYGGAQIRLVTPRGTSDFHGALFAYNRNSAFAANSFFNNRNPNPAINEKPSFRNRNQYGGKISGPMPVPGFGEGTPMFFKDKGYFFFAYEKIKDPLSAAANRTILTPSARTGAFSWNRTNSTSVTPFCPSQAIGSVCTIPDILSFARANLTNGTSIPAATDPVIVGRVLSGLPTESNFTGGDGLNTAGYRLIRRSDQERDTYTTRVDVDINDKNTINGVFSYNTETNLRPDVDTTKFTVIPAVTQSSTNKSFVLAYRRIFSNNFVNEVRGGIFTSEVPFDRTDDLPAYHLSLPLVSNPEMTFMSQGRNTKGFNYQDNADWIMGDHSLKFGGQLQYFKVNAYNDAGITATYTVGTGTATPAFTTTNFGSIGGISTTQLGTANGLMALLGGVINAGAQTFNIANVNNGFEVVRRLEPFRYSNHSLYFMDRWSVAKQVTLTLGVRYELFPSMKLANGVALEPNIPDGADPAAAILDRNGSYVQLGTNAGVENAYTKNDYNNFAPNLGISWAPVFENGIGKFLFGSSGRSVLRAGYSHSYGNDSIVTTLRNADANNAGFGATTSSAVNLLSGTTALNDRLSGGLTGINAPVIAALPKSYLANNTAAFSNFGTVFGIDPNLEIPRVDQFSFGFQREFLGNTAFEVRYVGTWSDNLARAVDLNQIDIFNSGFLADFLRAMNNDRLTGNAFCTAAQNAGCQPLVFFKGTAAGSQPILVGTGGFSLTTFNNNLRNGTPADLALSLIQNNRNNHPTVANPNAVPFIDLLPNPATGVADLFLNDGWYRYHSVQVELRRRLSQGLYFQANYTFSKNLTNTVGTSQTYVEPFLDNNNKQFDVQRADFDQTHVFNFNGIYQLPFGKGKSLLNWGGIADKVFGGWEVSGLAQWTSGAPITFVDTRGTLNRNGRSARQTVDSNLSNAEIKNLIGVFEQNGNIYWINPSVINTSGRASEGYGSTPFSGQAFFNVEPGKTGILGRTLVDGPRYFNINLAVLKNIRFGENMRVQLRAEAFNFLNNVNFNNNTQLASITATTFGQITSATGPREIQFAARFEF